jgi:N-acetylglucosamine-6-phosphate deacetylase
MLLRARRYDTSEAVDIDVAGGRIAGITRCGKGDEGGLPFVAPGFFDIQVNGLKGQEFSSLTLTPERVAAIVREHYRWGVTRLCPTLTTQGDDVLSHGLSSIRQAVETGPDVRRSVPAIHLEGPYMSREDGPRGAHPAEHCRPPDWDHFRRLQEAAGGLIGLITLSPEYDEAPAFIERAANEGVVVSIGHTAADSRQIRAAVDAGARLSTHLGNGAHRMLRRHPNYLWDQLADDRLSASLIVDGHHLPPEVVRVMVRAKGPERIILVSDLSGLAGLAPGRYTGSGCDVDILTDGRLVIAGQDQLLAGASRPIGAGIANVIRFAGIDLATAIGFATSHPARLMGQPSPELAVGQPADMVLFVVPSAGGYEPVSDLDVRATVIGGEYVYDASATYR